MKTIQLNIYQTINIIVVIREYLYVSNSCVLKFIENIMKHEAYIICQVWYKLEL